MKPLRQILDRQRKLFERGGKLEKLYPLYEAQDTFLYTPDHVTHSASHVRDGLDLKRMMSIVVVALLPCMFMAMYNTGYQAFTYITQHGAEPYQGWQTGLYQWLGMSMTPDSFLGCVIYGALFWLPVYIVTLAVGGLWEALFAIVRKHEINEGFLVTSALFPLILPPTVPLWQVALGISFGVVLGKEIFGGTGRNFLNPALVSRAFLFFAYPAALSGNLVWVAVTPPDASSGATMLARIKESGLDAATQAWGWWDTFVGLVPGSMGETSTLACLFGVAVLVLTGVGSWRIMAGMTAGTVVMALVFNGLAGKVENAFFAVPFWWHFVLGGWAFGMAFMATDPVSAAYTQKGKLIYGFFIGLMVVLIRVVNPAYPESVMLTILFMNMFAPLIDHFVVQANIKRRMARYAA